MVDGRWVKIKERAWIARFMLPDWKKDRMRMSWFDFFFFLNKADPICNRYVQWEKKKKKTKLQMLMDGWMDGESFTYSCWFHSAWDLVKCSSTLLGFCLGHFRVGVVEPGVQADLYLHAS